MKKVVVVGGGPAGLMAAIRAAGCGAEVTLIEKKRLPGQKLLLSGKGRCNLTNACGLDEFLARFSPSAEFLRDAFKKFFNTELMRFFETRGLALKVERQMRVFPVTDRAQSIVDVLVRELGARKVRILTDAAVEDIAVAHGAVEGVKVQGGKFIPAESVVMATGGASYSFTGSTGEGIALARSLGHSIVPLAPALVPLEVQEGYPARLKGLTLKNISLTFSDGKRKLSSETGELLFTDSGISGPLTLSLSGAVAGWLAEKKEVTADIDLKPALTPAQVEARLIRECKAFAKKSVKNMLKTLLPLRLIELCIELLRVDPYKQASQVTRAERLRIQALLKKFRMHITRTRPIEDAMVTRGGVSLKHIDPRTMGSRIVKGLYFAGEMIDVAADTGGFNLQAAFSTGYLAGESAALQA